MSSVSVIDFEKPQPSFFLKEEEDEIAGKFFRRMNEAVSADFIKYRDTEYAPHIEKTRELICLGADRLSKPFRVIVLGPGEIEPLKELTGIFQEVVLVDYVRESLENISRELGDRVKIVQFDLSRGLVELAKNIIVSAREKGLKRNDCMQEICTFFRDDEKTAKKFGNNFSLADIPNPADYVISSFVITQLANQVTSYVEERFEQLYGPFDEEKDAELITEFLEAEEIFRNRVQERHLRDIKYLLQPEGCAYLADAVSGVRSFGHAEDSIAFQLIQPRVLETVALYFDKIESRSWEWKSAPKGSFPEDPTMDVSFKIQAYLLSINQHSF